jgi:Co/Zn/Cd efflux system component
MHTQRLDWWQHEHVFGHDRVQAGERRTLLVVLLTAAMMVVEIAAGIALGSMALLADGLHMASHAAALGISVFATSMPAGSPGIGTTASGPARSTLLPASGAPSCW